MTSSGGIPLPVRPRPHRGETADSYLRRLAAANHLRFSYLRRYLATRGSYGPVDPGRLAALAGRDPHAILRAFPELAPDPPGKGRGNPRCPVVGRPRHALEWSDPSGLHALHRTMFLLFPSSL